MRKIITYGTFDLFHQGHYNILKRAKALGDYLIVGVTSESYDIERGKLSVRDDLVTRMENVKKTGFADEIIIEEYQGQKVRDIQKYNIDALVIGSDWYGKFDNLKQYCEVIYLERTKNISSTMIREHSDVMNVGIVTDDLDDNFMVNEIKYVSGFHMQNVFAKDARTGKAFCENFDLDTSFVDYEKFLKTNDLIYVKTNEKERFQYIKQALEHKKHVISEVPMASNEKNLKELFQLAEKNGVLLMENICTAYLRGFTQLIWMLQSSGILGKVYNVKAHISSDMPERQMKLYGLYTVLKILGHDYVSIHKALSHINADNTKYEMIVAHYQNAIATIEINNNKNYSSSLEILGEKGKIFIPDDWWNASYYKVISTNEQVKRYSFNFEGNGMRYILQEISILVNDKRTVNPRISQNESLELMHALEAFE